MKKPNTSIVASAIALAAVFAAHGILAADYYHRGDATANQAAQYDGSKVYRLAELTSGWYTDNECNNSAGESVTPGSGDSIYLRNGTYTILDGDTLAYTNYRIGHGWGTYTTNNITGGSLTLSDLFSVGYWNDGHGTVNISGGTVSANAVQVAPEAGDYACTDAHWNQSGGETTTTGDFRVASDKANSKGDATFTGGTLTVGANLAVATESGCTAEMSVENATVAVKGTSYIGRKGGTGTLTLKSGAVMTSGAVQVGSHSNGGSNGTLVMEDGSSLTGTNLYLADNSTGNTGTMTVNGGTALFTEDSFIGQNGKGTLNISDGTVSVGTATANKWLFVNNTSGATGSSINLSGDGVLDICHVRCYQGAGEINFDGGAIHAYANNGNCGGVVIAASDNLTVNVKAGGATFDVPSGVAVSIAEPLLEDATSTDGGLTKTGRGSLALANGNTYTGTTTVEGGVLRLGSGTYGAAIVNRGVLSFAAGQAFSGAVTIAKGGALAIDVSSAVDASTVAVGNTITLLSAPSLTLAEGDSLEEAVFLGGPAIEYTLAFENGALVATVTDVSHASSTRKVTAFIAEDAYIDNAAAWSNGTPIDESYDTVIFTSDATVTTWKNGWGDDWGNNKTGNHNIDCQTMVLRNVTILAQHDANFNPALDKNHIVGNGTLKLRRLGLERRRAPETTVTVGENITIEIVQTASNTDTWIAPCTINGDLRVTTGYTIFNSDIIVNGSATFTGEGKDSYITASTASGNTFNGDFIMEGGNFNFNSAAVTFGPNARLVLAGGTVSNFGNNVGMTNLVVSGGSYAYTALPGVGGADFHCSLEDGGTVEFTATSDGTITATALTAAGGKVVIDASAMTLSEGSTINLSQIALATGAAFGTDVEVQIAGTAFDWTISGTTATAATPADAANRWLGGASGNWDTATNWKYGVPTSSQTVVFDTNAVVTLSANVNVGTLSNANSTVQFRTSNVNNTHPTIFVSEKVSGKGTFQFYHAGIISATSNTDCPVGGGEDDDLTLEVLACSSDSWFEGSSSNGPLAIYAKMKSEGKIVFRRDVRLYGDNSGCTGAIECNGTSGKMYFANTNAGSANATWSFSGDVYLGATATDGNFTGTISFGTLNTSNLATMKVNTGVSGVVIEVGAGTWGNQYFLCGQDFKTQNNDDVVTKDVTLKKVGSGTLAYNGFGIPKIVVAEGVFSLGDPNTSLTHYSHTYTTIDSLTVAEGAVLTGSGTRTVTNTTLAEGAIIRQTITASDDTYTCPTLTINGTVDVEGVVGDLVDANSYLASAQATDELPTFTLLSATSVTGKPTGTVKMATRGWGWQAKTSAGTALVMRAGPTKPGLIIIIR